MHHIPKNAEQLLNLLCYLDKSAVPQILLLRGGNPQAYWNRAGEKALMDSSQLGLSEDLVALLSDKSQLDLTLETLLETGAIKQLLPAGMFEMIAVEDAVRESRRRELSFEQDHYWKQQAFLLCSHSFPSLSFDKLFRSLGMILVPHLKFTFHEHVDKHHDINVQEKTLDALLSASALPGPWKGDALDHAKHLSQQLDNISLDFSVFYRESERLRALHKLEDSDKILQHAVSRINTLSQHEYYPQLHAQTGLLKRSLALNLVQRDALYDAQITLNWSPLNGAPSTMERVVLNHIHLLEGKIFRYQGHFNAALAQYKQLLLEVETHENLYFDIRRELICNLADTLCELSSGEEAERVLHAELERLDNNNTVDNRGHSSRDISELKLSLVEALLQQNRLDHAQFLLDTHRWPKLPRAPQLRLLTLQARAHHIQSKYADAKTKWSEALDLVQKFPLGHGHASSAILTSLADALAHVGDVEFAKLSLEQARVMAIEGGCRFWIAGLGSYWLDWVKAQNVGI